MNATSIPSFIDRTALTLVKASQNNQVSQLVAQDSQGDRVTISRTLDSGGTDMQTYSLSSFYEKAGSQETVAHNSLGEQEAGDLASAVNQAKSAPDFDLTPALSLIGQLQAVGGFGGAASI